MRGCVVFPRCKIPKSRRLLRLISRRKTRKDSEALADLSAWPAGQEQVYVFLIALAESGNQAPSNGGEQLNCGCRLEACQHTERRSRDAKEFTGIGGGDVCRAWTIVNEGNFSEEIAGRKTGEFDFPGTAFHGHADVSAQDDIHAMADVAGFDNALTGRVGFNAALLEQGMNLIGAKLGEDRELRQKLVIM